MTSRGCLNAHPMTIDGAVPCFVPFHNVNCPKGFLYFNKAVSNLDSFYSIDPLSGCLQ